MNYTTSNEINENAFLQTTYIINEYEEAKINIIMDATSERTSINTTRSRKFNFKIFGKRNLAIYDFRSEQKKSILRNRIKINFRSIYDPDKIISI